MNTKPTILQRKPDQVSINLELCHFLPFSVSHVRQKGWEHKHITENAVIEMSAKETITSFDAFILIAGCKVFQDNQTEITNEILNKKSMLRIETSFDLFLKHYVGNNNKKVVIDSLKRLSSYQIFINGNDGSVKQQRYLYDFEISKDGLNVSFVISEAFYNKLNTKPWLINFDKLRNTKSLTGRGLFLFFAGNNRSDFYQETLEKMLNMDNDTAQKKRDNRKQIIKALEELKNVKFIMDYRFDEKSKKFILKREFKKSLFNNAEDAKFQNKA